MIDKIDFLNKYTLNEHQVEILTGVPAGDIDINGTVYYLVNQTLKKFIKNVKENK